MSSSLDTDWANFTTPSSVQPFDASCHGTNNTDPAIDTSIRIYFGATLFFVAVGLIGNSLSLLVFSSRDMQAVSSNVYLLTVAASDSVYLISVFLSKTLTMLRCWYFPEWRADIVNHSDAACITLQYLSDLFSDYSTCLILAFTVERAVAVFRPIRFKQLCTVARARAACALIFIVVSGTIAPYHVVAMGIWPGYDYCALLEEFESLFTVMYVFEMLLYRMIPVGVIATLNALIIFRVMKLARAKRQRRAIGGTAAVGGDEIRAAKNGTDCRRLQQSSKIKSESGSRGAGKRQQQQHQQQHHSEDRNLQLTIILILVSTSYVLAYIPVLIHFIMTYIRLAKLIDVPAKTMIIVGNYSRALCVAGFAINFFLYTVSGRVFRDQLIRIVCRCCLERFRVGGAGAHVSTTRTTAAVTRA